MWVRVLLTWMSSGLLHNVGLKYCCDVSEKRAASIFSIQWKLILSLWKRNKLIILHGVWTIKVIIQVTLTCMYIRVQCALLSCFLCVILFPLRYSGRVVKLAAYHHLVPRLRIRGVTHPLSRTLLWRGQGQLYVLLFNSVIGAIKWSWVIETKNVAHMGQKR
jgi:hypothetical protein